MNQYIALLKNEMQVVMGCTEPAAAALAGATAAGQFSAPIDRVEIWASRELIKNAMGVGIPNCSSRGIVAAVVLGICRGDPNAGLNIFSSLCDAGTEEQAALEKKSTLFLAEEVPSIYIRVQVHSGSEKSECIVSHQHDHIASVMKNGKLVLSNPWEENKQASETDQTSPDGTCLTLPDIYRFATEEKIEELQFLLDAATTNLHLANAAMEGSFGLSVGRIAIDGQDSKTLSFQQAIWKAASMAAAASDARMAGSTQAVVINSGSGNQGIACTVPVCVMSDYLQSNDEETIRALCISELVALMLTQKKGRLSALCGAFTAATGAGCGIMYLMGGGIREMDKVIRNMVANLMGIICDGAKSTCALKVFSSVHAAGISCMLAKSGMAPKSDVGILGDTAAETLDFFADLSSGSMKEVDKSILSIMLGK